MMDELVKYKKNLISQCISFYLRRYFQAITSYDFLVMFEALKEYQIHI